jgi:hypothetical protein
MRFLLAVVKPKNHKTLVTFIFGFVNLRAVGA